VRGFLDYFVGTPRDAQVEVLSRLERDWNGFDVAVIEGPVGMGKSKVAEAIARCAASRRSFVGGVHTAIVANNNILVNQYLSHLNGFQTLAKKSSYACHSSSMSCERRMEVVGGACKSESGNYYHSGGCPYIRDLRAARSAPKIIVNRHIYIAHKLYRPIVIFDEAHDLADMLQDMTAVKLWRKVYRWPATIYDFDDLSRWIGSLRADRFKTDENLELLRRVLYGEETGLSIVLGESELRGKQEEGIFIQKIDVSDAASILWGHSSVKKIILMSATISKIDIRRLGLHTRRVSYYSPPSPIPKECRPLVFHPVADLTYKGRQNDGVEKLAKFITDELLPEHRGERGVIHVTYEVSRRLSELVGSHPRLVFFGKENKKEVVEEWLSSIHPGDERVLVAAGLHVGLDLYGDLGRFQVIAVVPRRSLADPGMAWLAENRPEEYEWLTIRDLAQAYGRISRGPDDYGVTIITDPTAIRELRSPRLPHWMKEITHV